VTAALGIVGMVVAWALRLPTKEKRERSEVYYGSMKLIEICATPTLLHY
jgi:hypothetical protein